MVRITIREMRWFRRRKADADGRLVMRIRGLAKGRRLMWLLVRLFQLRKRKRARAMQDVNAYKRVKRQKKEKG